MKRLTNLDPNEVSLVPVGANQKRFLVLKEGNDLENKIEKASPKVLERVLKAIVKAFGKKDGNDEAINEKLDGLSPAAQTAARAIGRIAAPHADELKGEHVEAVLQDAGIDGVGVETESPGGSKTVKPEHMKSAKEAAESAYKEHMKKLGYQKYPEGKLQMKEVTDNAEKAKKPGDEDEEDDEDEQEKAAKAKKEKTMKEFIKADGTVDLQAIAKSGDADPVLVAIAKMHIASEARATAAETKASSTEKVLKEHREAVRKGEIVRKASEFKHLRSEDVQKTLELADSAGSEEFDRVVKMFQAQDAQIASGKLFTEVGTSGMSDGTMSAWGKIEKAADSIVQKSAEKISKEMAISDFLGTDEGAQLYAQHQASRPNGI